MDVQQLQHIVSEFSWCPPLSRGMLDNYTGPFLVTVTRNRWHYAAMLISVDARLDLECVMRICVYIPIVTTIAFHSTEGKSLIATSVRNVICVRLQCATLIAITTRVLSSAISWLTRGSRCCALWRILLDLHTKSHLHAACRTWCAHDRSEIRANNEWRAFPNELFFHVVRAVV